MENTNSNIFETLIGGMNLAPIKISGQYKIVIGIDKKLYLDDYTNRRVELDMNQKFLPQVAKFLNISTKLVDINKINYGGFQTNKIKSYHIPFYFNGETPKYFVISRVLNETIDNPEMLYQYGNIIDVVDLGELGFNKIFDEINSEKYFNYPLYFNWNENIINIYGYNINNDGVAVHTMDLKYFQANQPYLSILNNRILNEFENNRIFYPRFLNIELEFQFVNDYVHFNNFFGYLTSKPVEVNQDTISEKKFNIIKTENLNNEFVWKQINKNQITEDFQLPDYKVKVASAIIMEIEKQMPQTRYRVYKVDIGNSITIKHPNGDIEFEYIVNQKDIVKTSLVRTLLNICQNATKESERKFIFELDEYSSLKQRFYNIKVIWNTLTEFDEDYSLVATPNFQIIDRLTNSDNFNKFRGIKDNDIWIPGQPNVLNNFSQVTINNINYMVIEKFLYNGKMIIRLDKKAEFFSRLSSQCIIYEDRVGKMIELSPIPFLDYNSNLKSYISFEQKLYVEDLMHKFVDNASVGYVVDSDGVEHSYADIALQAIEKFNQKTTTAINQYIELDLKNREINDIDIIKSENWNTNIVLDMLFCSIGQTTYVTPNILNIDKHFYLQNGCVDINQLKNDILRYNWFLIKGDTPTYLLENYPSDLRSLRYFTNTPKITSRLVKVSDIYCETIFLGVKYQLPAKYSDYKFAVYLNPNNFLDISTNYKYEIDIVNKTLYLSINKYLDFIDLIRGADSTRIPLIDLNFFHNVIYSHNSNSDILENFKTGGIKLCPEVDESMLVYFNGEIVTDWKVFDNNKWYIMVYREFISSDNSINDFKLMFPPTGDATLYVYSNIKFQDQEYNYISMTITLHNIRNVETDYLWCENVSVKFFDTEQIFIKKFNIETKIEEIFLIDKTAIFDLTDKSNNIFGDYVKIGTIIQNGEQNTIELLLPDKTISLKEYYFEINQLTITDEFDQKIITKSVFKFPEFFNPTLTDNQIINLFDSTNDPYTFEQKITLFDRNQIWKVVKDIVRSSLKFKELFEAQIRQMINDLMITNLIDYVQVNSILVKNNSEFIKTNIIDIDRNIAIWDLFTKKISMFNRYSAPYFPYFEKSKNEIEFQLPVNKKNQTLFNVYDKDFGGTNIVATGLWEQVQGNIVSSLFCLEKPLELITECAPKINYKKILKDSLIIEQIIINDLNEKYIRNLNQNIQEYIIETYTNYLLDNFYKLDTVVELNQDNVLDKSENRINFLFDSQDNSVIKIDKYENVNLLQTMNKIKLVFVRK
jgi:hypothetical protein